MLVLTGFLREVGRRDRRGDERPARRRARPGTGLRPGAAGPAHAGAGRLRGHAPDPLPRRRRSTRGCRSSRSRPRPGWARSTSSTRGLHRVRRQADQPRHSCSRRSPATRAALKCPTEPDRAAERGNVATEVDDAPFPSSCDATIARSASITPPVVANEAKSDSNQAISGAPSRISEPLSRNSAAIQQHSDATKAFLTRSKPLVSQQRPVVPRFGS